MLLSTWILKHVRWQNIQGALEAHKKRLAIALEIHAFNRDLDDINDRINEKVSPFLLICFSVYGLSQHLCYFACDSSHGDFKLMFHILVCWNLLLELVKLY